MQSFFSEMARKIEIMVVEDEPESIRVLTRILREQKFKVIAAISGAEALALINKKQPDLILLDVKMPSMDGFEVCKRIKENSATKDLPVIFISGLDSVEDKIKGLGVGASDYIPKPFHAEEIILRVKNVLKEHMLQLELNRKNEEMENVLFAVHLGKWEWNVKTGKLIYDEGCYAMLGYSKDEISALNIDVFNEMLHPDDANLTSLNIERLFEKDIANFDIEFRLKHKNGYWVWINSRAKVSSWDAEGKALIVSGYHIDISNKKLDELLIVNKELTSLNEENEKRTEELLKSEKRYAQLSEQSRTYTWEVDAEGLYTFVDYVVEIVAGYKPDELINKKHFYDISPEEGRAELIKNAFAAFAEKQKFVNFENQILKKDGSSIWVSTNAIPLIDETGKIQGYRGSDSDITARKNAQEEMKKSEEKYRLLAESMADVIWVFNVSKWKFSYISPSVEQMRGYTAEEAMDQSIEESLTSEGLQILLDQTPGMIKEFTEHPEVLKTYTFEVQQPCKNGEIIWVEVVCRFCFNSNGEIEVVSSSRNIEDRKRNEKEILYLNFHDSLTGLFSRIALQKHFLDDAQSATAAKPQSAIVVNLDNFRVVNGALGHQGGDDVLVKVANNIKECVGNQGIAYRNSADEFIVIIDSCELEIIDEISKKILKSISSQIRIAGQVYFITASIGICIGQQAKDLSQTVKCADIAMYEAKREKNKIKYFALEMEQKRNREATLEKDIRLALENKEFEIYYQPIFEVRSGKINHAEALLRWNHPIFGQVSPVEFIPIAEKTKLILPITNWIILQACKKIEEWELNHLMKIAVSVNLSYLSFESRGNELVEVVSDAIRKTGIKPSSIKLEITESMLMRNLDEVVRVLHELKRVGVKIALDDFGTGYSSFGYLKDLPLDIVKLDRSLITNIVSDKREQMIVESMITIIHGLGLEVIVEGVEQSSQMEQLKQYECDYIQGYLFSKPLPAIEFIQYYNTIHLPGVLSFLKFARVTPTEVHFEWQSEWNCGNSIIDEQHKGLMRRANHLMSLTLKNTDAQELEHELNEIEDLVKDHFKDEEKILDEINYSENKEHRDEHEKLIKKMLLLKAQFDNHKIKPSIFFAFIIDDVIMGHVIDSDVKYFTEIRQSLL